MNCLLGVLKASNLASLVIFTNKKSQLCNNYNSMLFILLTILTLQAI